ncbi:MAG: glycosyltransferase [Coriobacteriia bacterium]|nr:glycosyltransferase [Coriobacteriia bacterium]
MSDSPAVTFGIIARAHIPELDRLVDRLLAIEGPADREIVVGVEDASADSVTENVDGRGVRWLSLPAHRGIPYNRNRVLEAASGRVLIGVDDDCEPKDGWLVGLLGALDDPTVSAAVGDIEIPPSGLIGDSISALGFPAGGSAGYATMFPVDADGTTHNIAAGNWATRTAVIRELGGFDESLTWGGEDTDLAFRYGNAGKRIVFVPTAVIVHPARTSLSQFSRWLYVRGRAKAQFSRRVPVSGFVANRLASFGRILKQHLKDPKLLLIAVLLVASVGIQWVGFVAEQLSPTDGTRP